MRSPRISSRRCRLLSAPMRAPSETRRGAPAQSHAQLRVQYVTDGARRFGPEGIRRCTEIAVHGAAIRCADCGSAGLRRSPRAHGAFGPPRGRLRRACGFLRGALPACACAASCGLQHAAAAIPARRSGRRRSHRRRPVVRIAPDLIVVVQLLAGLDGADRLDEHALRS